MKKAFNTILIVVALTTFYSSSKNTDELIGSTRNYINGISNNNLGSVASSFATNGVVVDVARRIEGRAAIRTWAANEVMVTVLGLSKYTRKQVAE